MSNSRPRSEESPEGRHRDPLHYHPHFDLNNPARPKARPTSPSPKPPTPKVNPSLLFQPDRTSESTSPAAPRNKK